MESKISSRFFTLCTLKSRYIHNCNYNLELQFIIIIQNYIITYVILQVSRIEASDDEWKEQLEEELHDSGLLDEQGRILRQVPNGLVNLNYDIHVCVHMGTELTPEESAYPPTAISFPGKLLT